MVIPNPVWLLITSGIVLVEPTVTVPKFSGDGLNVTLLGVVCRGKAWQPDIVSTMMQTKKEPIVPSLLSSDFIGRPSLRTKLASQLKPAKFQCVKSHEPVVLSCKCLI